MHQNTCDQNNSRIKLGSNTERDGHCWW